MNAFEILPRCVRSAVEEFGMHEPTKPQELAIPAVLGGAHVLLIAPTGTGKTEAAILPIFSMYLSRGWTPGIKILYIAPLRALNRDMLARLGRWGERLGIKIAVRHGDTSASERQRQVRDPPDMLITTPETLQAILPGKRISDHLRSVRWVVVDEIHELVDDKRGIQLSVGLERLVQLAGEFQRIGLSATVGSKEYVAKFLAGNQRSVEVVDAMMQKDIQVSVESPMPTPQDIEISDRLFVDPTMAARLRRLRELINGNRSVLVFVNTRELAEILSSRLRLLDPKLQVGVHHGSLSKEIRIEAETALRDGLLRGLISTSSMELGIDIGSVDLVVQYMSPRQVTRLVQRVGRSGHRVGELSKGLILSSNPDDIAESAVIVRRAGKKELEAGGARYSAFDVLAHQLAGTSLDRGTVSIDEALQLLRRTHYFKDLDRKTVGRILGDLSSLGLMRVEAGTFRLRKPGFEYYFTNLSMIPDTKRYRIRDIASRRSVGSLDEEFVVYHGEPGSAFIVKGEAWRIIEVDHERGEVTVEPIEDPLGAIPAWEGELIHVPFEVATEVGRLRARVAEILKKGGTDEDAVDEIKEEYPADAAALRWFVDQVREQLKSEPTMPTDEQLLIESSGNFSVLHACFGTSVNQTLAWVLATLLSARIGTSVAVKFDPYRIAFRFPRKAGPELIERTLRELKPGQLTSVLQLTLRDSPMFIWRLVNVAKRFGAIKRDADLAEINLRRIVRAFEGTAIYDEAMSETLVEKLDVERTESIISMLNSGELQLSISSHERYGPTPLAWPVLNELASGEIVVPKRAEGEILRALKNRLHQRKVSLYCMNCDNWSANTKVARVQDPPVCRNCGARLITLLPRENARVLAAIKKRAADKELTAEESREVKRAFQIASLVLTYGKLALLALSGRGVGPQTASRILSNFRGEDDGFYRAILQAERTYLRTRRFWASP